MDGDRSRGHQHELGLCGLSSDGGGYDPRGGRRDRASRRAVVLLLAPGAEGCDERHPPGGRHVHGRWADRDDRIGGGGRAGLLGVRCGSRRLGRDRGQELGRQLHPFGPGNEHGEIGLSGARGDRQIGGRRRRRSAEDRSDPSVGAHAEARGGHPASTHIDLGADDLLPEHLAADVEGHAATGRERQVDPVGAPNGRQAGAEQSHVEHGFDRERVHHHQVRAMALLGVGICRVPRA